MLESLVALIFDVSRLIVEVETPVVAVIAQPEMAENEVEQLESEDCNLFDDTHTT